jgi:hypothetical protein
VLLPCSRMRGDVRNSRAIVDAREAVVLHRAWPRSVENAYYRATAVGDLGKTEP